MQTLNVKFYYDAEGNVLAHPKDQRSAARVLEVWEWEEEPERRFMKVTVRELPSGKAYTITQDLPAMKRFFRFLRDRDAGGRSDA